MPIGLRPAAFLIQIPKVLGTFPPSRRAVEKGKDDHPGHEPRRGQGSFNFLPITGFGLHDRPQAPPGLSPIYPEPPVASLTALSSAAFCGTKASLQEYTSSRDA
jgi:hypothetical protein